MDIKELSKRAMEVKERYHQLEEAKIGKRWTNAQVMEGFVGDVGELMRIIMTKEGLRTDVKDVDERLERELSDCLYCILVLAAKYEIDMEKTFLESMDILEKRIEKE